MTDSDIASAYGTVKDLERQARAHWDAFDGRQQRDDECKAVMGVMRQAGALRRSLEDLIVTRATAAAR